MAIDTSMYNALKPIQIDSPVDAYAKVAQAQQMQQQNQLGQLKMDEYQRGVQRQNKLLQLVGGMGADATDESRINALKAGGYFDEADKLQTGILARQKTGADVAHLNAQSGELNMKTLNMKLQQHKDQLGTINDPQAAAQWVAAGYNDPELGALAKRSGASLQDIISKIPTDPAGFQRWKMQSALSADQLIKYTTPDANAQLQSATSLKTTAMTNATSRANNAATQAGENLRAGVMPGGGLDDNAERTAQAIASGQLPAPTGMALLNPKNQRILGRVMEINPSYDASTVSAKKAAATAFTSGQQGNAMRSFAVAGQHLDQLGQLVDAMNNGNSQLVNKIANVYSQQTGNPAVTNFDAAKDVVSKEVTKAIVAGGGGVSERQELSDMMKNVKSPAQLKGVIAQYRNLMAAQHDALLQQRRAAGLPDSTMPKYAESATSATPKPAINSRGWALHRDANGNQAYVSPDGKQYEEVK